MTDTECYCESYYSFICPNCRDRVKRHERERKNPRIVPLRGSACEPVTRDIVRGLRAPYDRCWRHQKDEIGS